MAQGTAAKKKKTSQETTNKDLIRRLIEEMWNKGNLDAADQYLAAGYVEHSSTPGEQGKGYNKKVGPEGMKDFVRMFRRAFPDITFSILQMVAEGEKVAVHVKGVGTHQGELMGLPPTGKQVVVTGAAIHRIADGKIVESDEFVDKMGLRMQLGVPEMGIMKA
jgi:steroid delta-isomerase-like uncharacterized protein